MPLEFEDKRQDQDHDQPQEQEQEQDQENAEAEGQEFCLCTTCKNTGKHLQLMKAQKPKNMKSIKYTQADIWQP